MDHKTLSRKLTIEQTTRISLSSGFLNQKTDRHDKTENLLKVALKHHKTNKPT
jgi:hypothetical protein